MMLPHLKYLVSKRLLLISFLIEMNRLKLVEKYARVWNTAPWAERLMWRQQEMHYMWNSNHAYDGGAFYRQMAKFTERLRAGLL